MIMIFNPVHRQWDNKGAYADFHRFRRWAWDTLNQAKNHIAACLSHNYHRPNFFNIVSWYLDANFVHEDETGKFVGTPAAGHVRRWLAEKEGMIKHYAHPEVVREIEALGVWNREV